MIAALTGQLVSKAPSHVVLDVHGVGYEVFIPLSTYFALPNLQESLSLHIFTHIRDNALQLFGFLTLQEKEVFVMLTGIPGLGGKLALSTLSTLPIEDLVSAIQSNDTQALATVPGIGKKSAGRIVLELKDKIAPLMIPYQSSQPSPSTHSRIQLEEDAVSALVNLGYRPLEVKEAVRNNVHKHQGSLSLADLIRATLKDLA